MAYDISAGVWLKAREEPLRRGGIVEGLPLILLCSLLVTSTVRVLHSGKMADGAGPEHAHITGGGGGRKGLLLHAFSSMSSNGGIAAAHLLWWGMAMWPWRRAVVTLGSRADVGRQLRRA